MRVSFTRHLLVEEKGAVVGIISMRDLVQLMLDEKQWLIDELQIYIRALRTRPEVAVLKEASPAKAGRRRADHRGKMVGAGLTVLVERGANRLGFADAEFETAGAKTAERPEEQLAGGDPSSVQRPSEKELDRLPRGSSWSPTASGPRGAWLADRKSGKISALSLDLLPRIARAQSMGYSARWRTSPAAKSVLLAANALAKFFPC
jgi:NAD/NADP transhydrogenase alpha subunit